MATTVPNVALYKQHIDHAGYARMIVTSMQSLLDKEEFRTKMIALYGLGIESTPDLQTALMEVTTALVGLQTSLLTIESTIRSNLVYPVIVED